MVTSHPTQLQLELGHAGEPVSAAVSAHLITCPQCSQFLRTLEHERERLLASESPGQFVSRLRQEAARQPAERWTPSKLRMGLGSSIVMAGTLAGTLAMAAIVAGRAVYSEKASRSASEQAARTPTAAAQPSGLAVVASHPSGGATPDGLAAGVSLPPPASLAPQQLSMQAGNRLLAINPSLRPYRVQLPEKLTERMGTGDKISPLLDICVTAQGTVKSVRIVTGSIAAVDAQVPTVIGRWKYRPYLVDGKAEPFCYLTRYSIEAK